MRQILHVDVNNAFLSWTAVDMIKKGAKEDIREIPAVIGGDETRRAGIVLAKSMKAKEFGIRTAQTIYQARIKCPNIQIFPSNYHLYKEYSNNLFNLLKEYTDKIERFSIDECFLDMTLFLKGRKLIDIANEISKRVKKELGFTVNIGVANNKLLAKMASDFQKPDKVHTLYKEEIPSKMWNLPVSELFMLGRKTVPKLYNMRIKTIGELAKYDEKILMKKFGKHGKMMWEYANGIDDSEVHYKEENPKGIGNSITLPRDISNIEELEEILLALSEQVTFRLRKHKMLGTVVNVQLRTKDFVDKTHQKNIEISTASTKIIYSKAKELLRQMYKVGTPIRLIGLRIDKLVSEEETQISFFENETQEKQKKLDKTLDELKNKYGYKTITRGGNLEATDILNLKKTL